MGKLKALIDVGRYRPALTFLEYEIKGGPSLCNYDEMELIIIELRLKLLEDELT